MLDSWAKQVLVSWTNVDLLSNKSFGIHLRTISQKVLMNLILTNVRRLNFQNNYNIFQGLMS